MQTMTTPTTTSDTEERTDLLEALHKHRGLFLHTVDGLSDEQAAARPTASQLCLGGLVKHVSAVEAQWARFVTGASSPANDVDWANIDWSNPPAEVIAYQQQFQMVEGETLAGIVAAYAEVAATLDELVRTVDLAARQPLPEAPWFEAGATWSARRVFVHVLAEVAQHAGHADIIRETIDGQKSMG
ncbi:DinB family protein [soil metagenome]